MTLRVVTDAEAEKATVIMCMPDTGVRYFSDDVETTCSQCGCAIIHRPHVPAGPPKVCVDCVRKMMED